MLQILKKTYPYYGKIYGVLILCILLGQVQGLLMLIEPQIISLIVDQVINPALGKAAETNSSIFSSAGRSRLFRNVLLAATSLLFSIPAVLIILSFEVINSYLISHYLILF